MAQQACVHSILSTVKEGGCRLRSRIDTVESLLVFDEAEE